MNFLASAPLVVACALAGTMHADLLGEPLGADQDGHPVFLCDIWPSTEQVRQVAAGHVRAEMFSRD